MLQLYGYDRNICQLSQSGRQIKAKTVKYFETKTDAKVR